MPNGIVKHIKMFDQSQNNNQKAFDDISSYTEKLKSEAAKAAKALERLIERQQELEDKGKQNTKWFQNTASKVRLAEEAYKEMTKQIDANAKALKESKNSLEQNQGLLQALKAKHDQLLKSKKADAEQTKALEQQIDSFTTSVSKQEKAVEKSKEKLDFYALSKKALKSSTDELSKSNKDFGPILSDVTNGFNSMKSGLSIAKTGFQTLGGAIKTTGLGLLVLVLQSVVEYFTETTEGIKKFKAITAAVKVVVDSFRQGLSSLGKTLIDAFTHPVESIKKLGRVLVDNVFNRLKAILVIRDGINKWDFKKISNGVLQAATGVTNVADKAVKAFNDVNNAAKTTDNLADNHHEKEKKRSREREEMYEREAGVKTKAKEKHHKNPPATAIKTEDEVQLRNPLLSAKSNGLNPIKELLEQSVQQPSLDAQKNGKVEIAKKTEEQILQARNKYIKDAEEKIALSKESDHQSTALKQQLELLRVQHEFAVEAARKKGEETTKIEEIYAKKKATLEDNLTKSKIHAGDKFIDAAMKGSKKDSAIFKAAFLAKKATSIADTIISTKRAVMDSFKAYASIPFVGQALGIAQAVFMGAQGAMSVAEITKQKPGYAGGGQFRSDGKGALLSGYSRTDDTNAYLRSGEAVVVSEAMRNPWARNLVSAINVAYGGRDFSVANTGSGYAIGGIYTDGGNSNRYYSQPANDVKDLANTLAYQMINNFPPVYVDVKDINTQQSILAKTVDRVNL